MSEILDADGPYSQLTLPEFLSKIALREQARKRLFGDYQVPNVPFATQGLLLFWEGCILGRAKRESLDQLVPTFVGSRALESACDSLGLPISQAQDPSWTKEYLLRVGPDGYRHFGGQPESLLDLFLTSFAPPDFDFRTIEAVRRLKKQKTPLESAILQGSAWMIVGTSLGLTMPDEAARLSTDVYGSRSDNWFSEVAAAGGLGPPSETSLPLDQMETAILAFAADFVSKKHPELLSPLGLSGLVSQ